MFPSQLYDENNYPVRICSCGKDYAEDDGFCVGCSELIERQHLDWLRDHPEDGPDYPDSFPLMPSTFPEAH